MKKVLITILALIGLAFISYPVLAESIPGVQQWFASGSQPNLLIYPIATSTKVLIGNNATSSNSHLQVTNGETVDNLTITGSCTGCGTGGGGSFSTTTINGLSNLNYTFQNTDNTITIATSAPGTITLGTLGLQPAGSYVTNSYASGTFATILSLNGYLTTTTAASTYYLQSNPSSYITSSALVPYLTTTTAASTYYLQTNPSNYLSSITVNSPLSGAGTAGSPLIFTNPGYITGNQTISLGGDLSGSGATSISGTVTGIQGKAVSLATGYLKYTGSAWTSDNSTFLTGNQSVTLSGVVIGSGATSIVTSFGTSTPYFSSIVLSASSSLASASSTSFGDSGYLSVTGQTNLASASSTGWTVSGVGFVNELRGTGIPTIPSYPNATGSGSGLSSSTIVILPGSTDIKGGVCVFTSNSPAALSFLGAITFGTPRTSQPFPVVGGMASSTASTAAPTASSSLTTLQIWSVGALTAGKTYCYDYQL